MQPRTLPPLLFLLLLGLFGLQCGAPPGQDAAEEVTAEPVPDPANEETDGSADPLPTPPPPPPPSPQTDRAEHDKDYQPAESISVPSLAPGSGLSPEVAAVIDRMPKFPLPYPNPSASARFSVGAFSTWGAVDDYITGKLFSEGFRGSYFYVPSGFALVSQVEQIDAEGNSLRDGHRFSLDNAPALRDDFNFFDYLRALLRPNPGKYRCIVFVLSPDHFQYSNRKLSREEAIEWLQSGYNRLPTVLRPLPVTEDYELTILVYEFLKPEHDNDVAITIPSNLDALSHIQKANLMFR